MNFEANLPVITNVRAQNEAVYTGTAKELQEKKAAEEEQKTEVPKLDFETNQAQLEESKEIHCAS
jgi:hypothetical protein